MASNESAGGTPEDWIAGALDLDADQEVFPWQLALYERLQKGEIPRLVDIPTGLGKTSVMAIWLVARALGDGDKLPRRLVYVVDRRAIVDQATTLAEDIREFVEDTPKLKKELGLGSSQLPISTLRGQHIDNREWLEDPASPAIIVGTVDMIGSRLLFEGYNVSRKMRPYHAALLGTDALVVLDESHLVPPFEKLIAGIADDRETFGPADQALREVTPSFEFMALSATDRNHSSDDFRLQDRDLKNDVVDRRLNARKLVTIKELDEDDDLVDQIASRAWERSGQGQEPTRIIVYSHKRTRAEKIKNEIQKRARADETADIMEPELFVGARRVYEREQVARWLEEHGFLTGADADLSGPAFLIATSAGEVGVDLDADHVVCDLVPWERMVQRLGRVNRLGGRESRVDVVVEYDKKGKESFKKPPEDRTDSQERKAQKYKRRKSTVELLSRLPEVEGQPNASTGAIQDLKRRTAKDEELSSLFQAAVTPEPIRPSLTRPLLDAWAMTSLEEHTGRPEVEPWLRGWDEDDEPQTRVVWRHHLPVRWRGHDQVEVSNREIERYFEAAPPHLSEVLETETRRVDEWLRGRAKVLEPDPFIGGLDESDAEDDQDPLQEADIIGYVLTAAHELEDTLTLADLLNMEKGGLQGLLSGCTLVVDVRVGGLNDGLLDDSIDTQPRTVDDGETWLESEDGDGSPQPVVPFRVRVEEAGEVADEDSQWMERHRFRREVDLENEPLSWIVIEEWRHDAATEDDRSVAPAQLLSDHQAHVEEKAKDLGNQMRLPEEYVEMLSLAARFHDEGKRAKRWQQAANAPGDGVYAKTSRPPDWRLLDGYRHELGSLLDAEKNEELADLSEEVRDSALHLIAAHHGYARPVISTQGCETAPPSILNDKAEEITRRYARLQERWGPWGLAWWEALLRAADQQASREVAASVNPDGEI